MATIKFYPPKQLPSEGVSDSAFNIWVEETEVYLDLDPRFQKFLPGGRYENWESAESNPDRIKTLSLPEDAEGDIKQFRRELRQFLTIIAKLIHPDYYNPIIRHSTSLTWIYTRLRQDLNLEQQGIHFLNVLDLKWDPSDQTTPIGFYNKYRSLMMGNLGKKDDKIHWQNSTLKEDEKLTPSHEDLILLNVLQLLHPKLPHYVKDQYAHKIGQNKRIMDFKTDILNKAKQYIEEIENNTDVQLNKIEQVIDVENEEEYLEPQCNYINSRRPDNRSSRYQRGSARPYNRQRFQPQHSSPYQPSTPFTPNLPPFCRVCQLAGQPRHIFTSHYLGDDKCPSISNKDKNQLLERTTAKLNNLQVQPDLENEYGYAPLNQQTSENNQVLNVTLNSEHEQNIIPDLSTNFSNPDVKCNFIKPVPSQCLTVEDPAGKNIHIDLDTGATVSYVKYDAVKRHNFNIKSNNQLSNLADGKTKMPAMGEIDETFYRNDWKVRFHAIVSKDLHCDFVGGNNFFKDNSVTQDINNKTISVHKRYTVPETNKLLILPTAMSNMIIKNNHINVVLPGNTVQYPVPHPDDELLAVQPCFQNKQDTWPSPQICKVSNGFIDVLNDTNDILSLKNGMEKVQIRTLNDFTVNEPKCFATYTSEPNSNDEKHTKIHINSANIDSEVIDFIRQTNEKYKNVFNEDLSNGYNMNFGRHVCNLNWANDTRPPANKVHNINYDHDTKVLLQQVCDEFTQAGVLGIPQDYGIQVQHVSPAFLVRKQRAKNKPKNELTPKDVRLVVNFGKINDHLKNIPTPITKPRDIFTHLGRWKHIIVMDLFQGFFQNHMSTQDGQWMGISTPFGGLRFMRRSGQGLLGQSEELDELLAKVLSLEIQSGFVTRIADDLYIGGATPMDTAKHYEQVLAKLSAANLKVSADKTKVFLQSVDILGWVWQKGGFLAPSPHRINSLKNTSYKDIQCIKDLRSWLGLYKTLMPASPSLTLILDPFDKVIADRDSKDDVNWNETLKMHFTKAKEAVDSIQTLYLPDPNDQLLIVVDAAKAKPGLGHILYAIKDNKKLPVSFHSNKLSDSHAKWHSCELEALAFSTAITAEYHVIKESKKPVIIAPDSKAVADACNLIKKGQHSSNPRIQALITNVNRIPIIVQLASGKNKLNICGDHQSRFPSSCQSEHCSICNFVNESTDTVLNPHAINAMHVENMPNILTNKAAWKQVQIESKSCQQTLSNLTSGKTPSKNSGKLFSEIRRLSSLATINNEGLLVVLSKPNPFSAARQEQIVIPSSHLPAVLWQLHNSLNHPSKSQLKSQFEKYFYSVGLHPELDKLYFDCHFCVTQMKIPSVLPHYTQNDDKIPGTSFHADIIKRRTQCILTIRDNFSTFTVAKIVRSEGNKDLKDGIIELLSPIKLHGNINVKVDNATGFKPLLDNKDHDLTKLGITIIATDVFNINENAVVDRACYELEQELIRLEPDGRQVTNTTIQLAVQTLNQKLRRNGKLSAFEIFFNRDGMNGSNLQLDYDLVKQKQLENRDYHNERHNAKVQFHQQQQQPLPGDIVITNCNKQDKHKARDTFIITATNDDKVKMQKIIHTQAQNPNLRGKVYTTSKHRVHVTRATQHKKIHHKPTLVNDTWMPYGNTSELSSDEESFELPPVDLSLKSTNSNVLLQSFLPPRISSPQQTSPPQPPPLSSPRPPFYQQYDQWLTDQRQQAATELTLINQQSASPTKAPDSSLSPEPNTRAKIKERAKLKIAACYGKSIPQVDGCLTDSSAPTSTDPSPNTSPVHENIINHLQPTVHLEPLPSYITDFDWNEWDYHEVDLLYQPVDPENVFVDPDPSTVDFLARHASI